MLPGSLKVLEKSEFAIWGLIPEKHHVAMAWEMRREIPGNPENGTETAEKEVQPPGWGCPGLQCTPVHTSAAIPHPQSKGKDPPVRGRCGSSAGFGSVGRALVCSGCAQMFYSRDLAALPWDVADLFPIF